MVSFVLIGSAFTRTITLCDRCDQEQIVLRGDTVTRLRLEDMPSLSLKEMSTALFTV